MFTKKALIRTFVGLFLAVTYEYRSSIPDRLVRPLIVIGVIAVVGGIYLYQQGYFSEEKIVDTIAEHVDQPFAATEKSPIPATSIQEQAQKEREVSDAPKEIAQEKSGLFQRVPGGDEMSESPTAPPPEETPDS